jgi:hypothetical protein
MCTPDFKNINEKLREQFIIPLHSDIVKNMFLPNDTMNLDNEKCGFGHPPIEAHIELADKIYKNCFKYE